VGTTSWSALANLLPGTNLIQAYAVDTAGNKSMTNSVNMDYVVTNQLRVRMTALEPSPPTTAMPGWRLDATTASLPLRQWICIYQLGNFNQLDRRHHHNQNQSPIYDGHEPDLQVNFLDVTKPTLAITAPTAGKHMSNAWQRSWARPATTGKSARSGIS